MSYNTDRRKPLTKKQRAQFLLDHNSTCYFCGKPITDDNFDDEHIIAKELMPSGSDWNAMSNRAPIHRVPCHKIKTAQDIKAIAKSNRIRKKEGLDPITRKHKPKAIAQPKNFKWPSRPFKTKKER